MTPALDERASATAGEPLELLPVSLAERAAPAPTWTLTDGALRFLWDSRGRGLQNGRRRGTPEAAELRDAGLLNRFGAPTPTALELLTVMAAPTGTLIATLRGGPVTERWSCWFRGGAALVDEGTDQEGGPHALGLVPAPIAIARLIDWLGVAPAWSFGDDAPVRVSASHLDARCADETVPPPPDARPALLRSWGAGQWRRVLVADGDRSGVVAVRTGAGWWRATPETDGALLLAPLPSAALVQQLLALAPFGGAR